MASEPASAQSLRPLQAWRAGAVASELASTQSLRPLQAWRAGAVASEPASTQSLRPLQAWRAGAVVLEPASAQSLCPLQAWRVGAVASEPASAQSLCPLRACIRSEPPSTAGWGPWPRSLRVLGAAPCRRHPSGRSLVSPHLTDGLFPGGARRAGERGLSVDHHAALRLPGRELPGKRGPRGRRPVAPCQGF